MRLAIVDTFMRLKDWYVMPGTTEFNILTRAVPALFFIIFAVSCYVVYKCWFEKQS